MVEPLLLILCDVNANALHCLRINNRSKWHNWLNKERENPSAHGYYIHTWIVTSMRVCVWMAFIRRFHAVWTLKRRNFSINSLCWWREKNNSRTVPINHFPLRITNSIKSLTIFSTTRVRVHAELTRHFMWYWNDGKFSFAHCIISIIAIKL